LHLFFRWQSLQKGEPDPGSKNAAATTCREVFWRPHGVSVFPPGGFSLRFLIWWAFHHLGVFYNRDYAVFLMFDGPRLVHRSCIFPGFFRFPFMGPEDLQVGDTWTHPDLRGKGLATHALRAITGGKGGTGRNFWYVVEASNQASIRAVEKAGFERVGMGSKRPRAGLRVLGYYAIENEITLRGQD